MSVITRQYLVDVVAEHWRLTYQLPDGRWKWSDKEAIYNKLKTLTLPTASEVNEIIGNISWTRLACDSCHKEVEAAYQFDVTGGEYITHICASCLRAAVKELKSHGY